MEKMNLKKKFLLLLAIVFGILIIISVLASVNLHVLTGDVDGLMINNYKSINSTSHMNEILAKQNRIVLDFVFNQDVKKYNSVFDLNEEFNKWFLVERNNITEKNEKESVEELQINYNQWVKNLTVFIEYYNKKHELLEEYYNKQILPVYEKTRQNIITIRDINEQAMLESKSKVAGKAESFTYMIITISFALILAGIYFSMIIIKTILKPIFSLTDNMKEVTAGNLEVQAPIISKDEIGILTKEFNVMTRKLSEFEKNAKNEISTEKNRSSAIIKNMPDPIMFVDNDLRIKMINRAGEDFFRIVEREIKNTPFFEIIDNIDLYSFISSFIKKDNEEEMKPIKFIQLYSDEGNNEFYFNVIATKIRDSQANISGIVISFQNITDLKKVEKMRSSMIAAISHEFKTPLTSIVMGVGLLKDPELGPLNTKQKEVLETINEDSDKIFAMIQNLLQMKELESRDKIFNFSFIDIKKLTSKCINDYIKHIDSQRKKLETNIEDNIPEIYADSEKLRLVINNLLSNAIKFTEQEDTITIKVYTKENMLYYCVEDTGTGIPEDKIEKIFEKYYQIDDHKTKLRPEGSGIGLSVAREIIRELGGEIYAESNDKKGSRFIFKLKLK